MPRPAVLTAQADVGAFGEQGGEGEGLARAPVEGSLAGGHLAALAEHAPDLRMGVEVVGQIRQPLEQLAESRSLDACLGFGNCHVLTPDVAFPDGPRDLEPPLLRRRSRPSPSASSRARLALLSDRLGLFASDSAELEQVVEVAVADRGFAS